jgi:hypothetical protein
VIAVVHLEVEAQCLEIATHALAVISRLGKARATVLLVIGVLLLMMVQPVAFLTM